MIGNNVKIGKGLTGDGVIGILRIESGGDKGGVLKLAFDVFNEIVGSGNGFFQSNVAIGSAPFVVLFKFVERFDINGFTGGGELVDGLAPFGSNGGLLFFGTEHELAGFGPRGMNADNDIIGLNIGCEQFLGRAGGVENPVLNVLVNSVTGGAGIVNKIETGVGGINRLGRNKN